MSAAAMTTTRPREPELTTEQLQMALRHLQRPTWPATLAAVLAHPLFGPCVRGLARSMSRCAWPAPRQPRPTDGAAPVPPTPTAAQIAARPGPSRSSHRFADPPPRIYDFKRAAANDFD